MALNVEKVLLPDGNRYSGYGDYSDGIFIPNGCGTKYFSDMYTKGNFVNGILNGPAIISHNNYMYTVQMKEDRGNGWGLSINRGQLVDFGYYSNSQIKTDLLEMVEWYFKKMISSGRQDESMLRFKISKDDFHLEDLHIGYAEKILSNGVSLSNMGFHFLNDGSVFVGHYFSNKATGDMIKFCDNGYIQVGFFIDGVLIEEKDIQEVIDSYYGIYKHNDSFFASMFKKESKRERENQRIRKQFRNIVINTSKNYFI